MKKWIRFGAAALLALILCTVSGGLLLTCMKPMEDRTYDLSLTWEGESEGAPEDWVYNQKGWTVFIQEGDIKTELIPNGFGGFSGLEEPGQTFYFSRILSEELDSPTLRLDRADRSFAVFLDGALLYTDCPELDNCIGYLRLPMQEWTQKEPVLITLPWDYMGKTLTIAQSTNPFGGETQNPTATPIVWPCSVTLYCGYAYESALVAESFQAAVPATLTFIAGTLLLALFAIQAFRGAPDLGSLCGGLIALFWMAGRLDLAFLPNVYFGLLPVDAAALAQDLSLTLLLIFLISRLTGWRRVLLGLSVGVQGVVVALEVAAQITKQLTLTLILTVSTAGLMGLTMAWIFGILEWKKSWFFRCFCSLTMAGAILWAALGYSLFPRSLSEIPGLLLQPLTGIMMAAALITALMEAIRREAAHRTETRLLVQRSKLAQSSYEVMRQQHEQVMILRHDMMKHFQLLWQTTGDEKTAAYLEELIGQNEKIRPVVQSGNEILDVILNGKLSAATDAGIAVEIVRMQAPDKLPLSDAELCSLMMNLLDNAVEAAAAPGVKLPYIKLDLCVKEHFFVLFCENSTTLKHIQKETAPGHGLGLKIIKEIAARYDNLLETEYGVDYYSVKLAIPLD